MKLVIPIFYGTSIYTDCEITTPSGEVIADSRKLFDQDKPFTAMLHFIHGCVMSVTGQDVIEERGVLKDIVRSMPHRTSEWLVIQIMLEFEDDDGVEGIYPCPRCKTEKICELTADADTRDFIKELEVNYFDSGTNEIDIEWSKPFEIKDKKGELLEAPINSIKVRFATLGDCINAYARYGSHEKMRMQYKLYADTIIAVNGTPVSDTWRKSWGMYIFEKNRNIKDINRIASVINSYGMQSLIKKYCNKCGKEWEEHLNTSNFFVSALQSE